MTDVLGVKTLESFQKQAFVEENENGEMEERFWYWLDYFAKKGEMESNGDFLTEEGERIIALNAEIAFKNGMINEHDMKRAVEGDFALIVSIDGNGDENKLGFSRMNDITILCNV